MYYKSLFNINIHHGYFLDKGEEKYLKVNVDDDEMSTDDKAYALRSYDLSEYLQIIPSDFTKTHFRNYRMVMRSHASGFRVLVNALEKTVNANKKYQPLIPLEDDIFLTFELQASDPLFFNYTDTFDLSDHKMYLFTNAEPADQEASFENLFANNGGLIDSRFLLKAAATRDLIKIIAEENESFITYTSGTRSLAKNMYLIESNEDLSDAQKEAEIEALLNNVIEQKKKKQVIGYVRLRIKGNANDRHLLEYTNDTQYTKATPPQFTISFVNLKTFWRFKSVANNATLTTKQKKWLSRNGYVEITSSDFDGGGLDPPDTNPGDYNFPNPTVDMIKKENNNYYSEIFI